MSERPPPPPIIGVSPGIRRACELVERFADTRLPMLVQGATGTGKEVLAQHIHHRSGRPGGIVDVNCAALPREMVESLLFGHRKGAFTGAAESVPGHIERAHGTTLFLDELLQLPVESQGKLLRVFETGEVQRLGDGTKRAVDVRLVGAMQEDLWERLESGLFRRDLYQRLAGILIRLPPLLERMEDVPLLAEHFAAVQGRSLERGCTRVMQSYAWPGNVRELRVTIERAGHLVDDATLPAAALVEAIELGIPGSVTRTKANCARSYGRVGDLDEFRAICEASGWGARKIAAALGIARSTLFYRLKADGVSLRQLRQSKSNGQSKSPLGLVGLSRDAVSVTR